MKKVIRKKEGLLERIIRRLFDKKLMKNKVYSILIILLGYATTFIEGDCTAFILMLFIGIPLFFAKKNYIV